MKYKPSSLTGLKRRQSLLYVMIFSLVTIIIWAGISIFKSQTSVPIPNELLKLSQPLNPNLDSEIFTNLASKTTFAPGSLNNFPIFTLYSEKNGRDKRVVTITDAKKLTAEQKAETKTQVEELIKVQESSGSAQLNIPTESSSSTSF